MDTGINMLGQFEGESSDFQQQQSQTSIGFADIQGTGTNEQSFGIHQTSFDYSEVTVENFEH